LNERYGGFSGGRIGLGEHVRRCGERIRYGEHALPGWIVDSIVKDFLQARNEIDYGGNVKTSGRMITSEQWNTLCTAYEKIAMWFKNECKVDMNDLEHVDFDIAAPAPTDRR